MSCSSLTGRPFALELLNPHRARFDKAEIRQLQEVLLHINKQKHSHAVLILLCCSIVTLFSSPSDH